MNCDDILAVCATSVEEAVKLWQELKKLTQIEGRWLA